MTKRKEAGDFFMKNNPHTLKNANPNLNRKNGVRSDPELPSIGPKPGSNPQYNKTRNYEGKHSGAYSNPEQQLNSPHTLTTIKTNPNSKVNQNKPNSNPRPNELNNLHSNNNNIHNNNNNFQNNNNNNIHNNQHNMDYLLQNTDRIINDYNTNMNNHPNNFNNNNNQQNNMHQYNGYADQNPQDAPAGMDTYQAYDDTGVSFIYPPNHMPQEAGGPNTKVYKNPKFNFNEKNDDNVHKDARTRVT